MCRSSPEGAMLARHFESGDGLYEGTLGDVRAGWLTPSSPRTMQQRRTTRLRSRRSRGCSADDDDLLDALEAVMDLDAFYRFWAVEIISQHGDGYTGNHNRSTSTSTRPMVLPTSSPGNRHDLGRLEGRTRTRRKGGAAATAGHPHPEHAALQASQPSRGHRAPRRGHGRRPRKSLGP